MIRKSILVLALGALAAAPLPARAQSGGAFDLTWSAFGAGGARSTGAGFDLAGIVAPSNAGRSTGGAFVLDGGWGGVISVIDVPEPTPSVPVEFSAPRARPNPFSARTTIAFETPRTSAVRLGIYDLHGRLVKALIEETLSPGRHRVDWSGADDAGRPLPGGVYFARIEAGSFRHSSRIVLLH